MPAEIRLFLDTNILIYASVKEAPYHEEVSAFVDHHLSLETPLYVSRQVLREYLAVLSRTSSFSLPRNALLDWANVWRNRCHVLEESPQVTEVLFNLFAEIPFGGKQIHDANIVALLLTNGLDTLVTTNLSDFERFSHLLKIIDPRNQP